MEILREIKFGIFEALKITVIAILRALKSKFCLLGKFQRSESAKIHQKSKFRDCKCVKMTLFETLDCANFEFHVKSD